MITTRNKVILLTSKINFLSCVLMCTWFTLPFFRVRAGVSSLLLIFGIWIATTDLRWLTKRWSIDLVFALFFFITFIPYLITGNVQYGSAGPKIILVHFPLFFVGIFINHYYMYYKKDYGTLSKVAFITLVFFIIGSVQTFIGLSINPMASRILATGVNDYETEKILFNRMGVGGFGYVYASCFLLVSLLYHLISKNHNLKNIKKAIVLVSILSLLTMIIEASYAIALIIILSGFILVLIVKKKKTLVMLMVLLSLFLLLVQPTFIGNFFLSIANLFNDNLIIQEKFTDIGMSFFQNAIGNQTNTRIELYLISFNTFLKQPLFGIYGPFGNYNYQVGGHSGWLDILGYFGVYSGLPLFFVFYYNFRKNLKLYRETKYYGYLVVIYFLFFIVGMINPILYVYEVGFVIFMIVPIIPMLVYDFSILRGKENENTLVM